MSTESDSNCPICQDTCEDVASTLPCHHQFCLGCILRWTQRNPVCPLCRRTVATVRFSDHGEDDYLETSITVPEELPDGSNQAERDPSRLDENSSHPPVTEYAFSKNPQDVGKFVVPSCWSVGTGLLFC
uniref:RING-type E3 ubiquitin transferase n=1 Tax=Ficedula albicollis TaxID=59894 RepID=U3KK41_FICAL